MFDLASALVFGAALGVVSLLSRAASETFGNGGIYLVAFVSGLSDVDAVLISAVQMPAPEDRRFVVNFQPTRRLQLSMW